MTGLQEWHKFLKHYRDITKLPYKTAQREASKLYKQGIKTIKTLIEHFTNKNIIHILDKNNKKIEAIKTKNEIKMSCEKVNVSGDKYKIQLKNIKNKNNSGAIIIKVLFDISNIIETRYAIITVHNLNKQQTIKKIRESVNTYTQEITPYIKSVIAQSVKFKKATKKHKNMILNDIIFQKLPYDIDANNNIVKKNCVYDTLKKFNHSKTSIRNAKKIKTWTIQKLIEYCHLYKISYKFYNQSLKTLYEHKPNNKKKTLYAILSNEHIYPITKKELSTIRDNIRSKGARDAIKYGIDNVSIKYIEDVHKYTIDNINKERLINYKIDIAETLNNNIYEVSDDDTSPDTVIIKQCLNIDEKTIYTTDNGMYNAFNLSKKIMPNIIISPDFKRHDILKFQATKYDLYSSFTHFLPSVSPILYNVPQLKNDNIKCIDANKFYAHAMSTLEYVPVIRANSEIRDYNEGHIFKKTNFYYVSHITRNTYNILKCGWTSGYRLDPYKAFVKIDKYLEPTLKKNPFKNMICDMLKEDAKTAKNMINRFIGMMQINESTNTKTLLSINKIYNNQNEISNTCLELHNSKLLCDVEKIEISTKYSDNMLPFAHYIVDYCINVLSNKILQLSILDKDIEIVKINIDSISYIGNIDEKYLNIGKNAGQWKYETFKPIQNIRGYASEDNKSEQYKKPIKVHKKINLDENNLVIGYAGNGKTHYIINNLIPAIKSTIKYDTSDDNNIIKTTPSIYIIGATHKALSIHYNMNDEKLTTSTIDSLQYTVEARSVGTTTNLKQYLNADYIIIEEVGLLTYNHWEFIYKHMKHNSKIIAFGDNKQLKPVKHTSQPLDNHLIISMFDRLILKHGNWRNNFTTVDYDEMIKGKYDVSCINDMICDIKKVSQSTKYKEYNICYYNKTVNKIHSNIIANWKDSFSDMKIKRGAKVMCTTNDLKKHGIFNNYIFKVKYFKKNTIVLIDEYNKEHKFTPDIFNSDNFTYAYAFTLYKIQGQSIPKNKIAFYDMERIKKDGSALYTAISRIKEKVSVCPTTRDIKIIFWDHGRYRTTNSVS